MLEAFASLNTNLFKKEKKKLINTVLQDTSTCAYIPVLNLPLLSILGHPKVFPLIGL